MSGLYIPAHTGPQPPTGHHGDIVSAWSDSDFKCEGSV